MSEHDRDTSEYAGIDALREALQYITRLESERDQLRERVAELESALQLASVRLHDRQMDRP